MAIYTIITLVAGIVPKIYIVRHTLKLKKVATLDLTLEEKVQVLGLTIAGSSGLFLLGNYGVKGDFHDVGEKWLFGVVMITGGASLLVTAVWKGLVILSEIKRDQEAAVAVSRCEGATGEEGGDETPVTQISSIWVGLGVVATIGKDVQARKQQT